MDSQVEADVQELRARIDQLRDDVDSHIWQVNDRLSRLEQQLRE